MCWIFNLQCRSKIRLDGDGKEPRSAAHVSQAGDVIDAHAVVRVERGDLAARADVQPLAQVARGLEVQRVVHQQRQREVVHPVPALSDLQVGPVVLVDLAQQPAPGVKTRVRAGFRKLVLKKRFE